MAEKESPTLCGLPTELQHLIVLNLHPSAAITLSKTNRWFHAHISLHHLDKHEVSLFLSERECLPERCTRQFSEHTANPMNYACYSCLCLKPAAHFTLAQVNGDYDKGRDCKTRGRLWDQRFCIDCGTEQKKFRRGQLLEMAGGAKPKAFCAACRSVQDYFCPQCRWCVACIASLRTWTARVGRCRSTTGEGRWSSPCQSHLRR